VQEHAEELLKEMSLSSYYDEVALKGLELAARDLARGVLTHPQVERIKDAVMTLITELADYDDVDPGTAPLAKASPDRSAAQDLPKHPAPDGAMPESLKLPAKWRDEKPIQCVAGVAGCRERFRREGVPMVCVCYLDMSGHTSPSLLTRSYRNCLIEQTTRIVAQIDYEALHSSFAVRSFQSEDTPEPGPSVMVVKKAISIC
jgi:hypothetical protein